MIALFTILTIVFVIGRVIMGYFANVLPLLNSLLSVMTWISVILGIIDFVFISIRVFSEINKLRVKKDHNEEDKCT